MSEVVIKIKEIQSIETQMAKCVKCILDKERIHFSFAYGSVLGAVRHNGPIPWDFDMDIYVYATDLINIVAVLRNNLPKPFTVDYYDINPDYRLFYPRVALRNSSSDVVHIDIFPLCGLPENENERIEYWKKINKINEIYCHRKVQSKYVDPNRAKWKYMLLFARAKLIEIAYLPISKKKLRDRLWDLYMRYPVKQSTYVAAAPDYFPDIIARDLIEPIIMVNYSSMTVPIPEKYDLYLKHFYNDYLKIPDEKTIEYRYKLDTKINLMDYEQIKINEKEIEDGTFYK